MKNWEKYKHEIAEWVATTENSETDSAIADGCFRGHLTHCALCPCGVPVETDGDTHWMCKFSRSWLNQEANG